MHLLLLLVLLLLLLLVLLLVLLLISAAVIAHYANCCTACVQTNTATALSRDQQISSYYADIYANATLVSDNISAVLYCHANIASHILL
jgi:flagellar basal body-associated protein FliL